MEAPFTFRPGTLDEQIYCAVVDWNEYELPDAFRPDDVVLDVGAHIGSFCLAALSRGANRVYAFEAEPANYEIARKHLRPFGERAVLTYGAVWRSDGRGPKSLGYHYPDPTQSANSGGGNVVWSEGETQIPTIPFDTVLYAATNEGERRVRFLKIDCEGSEFPILLTSNRLGLIDEIAGEFHEFGGDHDEYPMPVPARVEGVSRFTIHELAAKLRADGFTVNWRRNDQTNIGLFRALRSAS
jgi:FkbM family methyltransferase